MKHVYLSCPKLRKSSQGKENIRIQLTASDQIWSTARVILRDWFITSGVKNILAMVTCMFSLLKS